MKKNLIFKFMLPMIAATFILLGRAGYSMDKISEDRSLQNNNPTPAYEESVSNQGSSNTLSGIYSDNLSTSQNQERDISNEAISRIDTDLKEFKDGSNFEIRVDYDNTRTDIKNGDYINISWNHGNKDLYIEGYRNNIPLHINHDDIKNLYVGDANIYKDHAKVTFNKNIEGLKNICGFVSFQAIVRNFHESSNGSTHTAVVRAGDQEKIIKVKDQEIKSDEKQPRSSFYYKTGDILPEMTDKVRWGLMINNNKEIVRSDEILITDEIQKGQKLDLDSFDICFEGILNERFYGKDAIENLNNRWNRIIIYDCSDVSFKVSIPNNIASYNAIRIMYKTSIIDSNLKEFKNNTTIYYRTDKEDMAHHEVNAIVKNVSSDAGIDGEKDKKPVEPIIVEPIEEIIYGETVNPIDDIVIAYPNENVVVDDMVEPIKSTQPVIHIEPSEEIVDEETVNPIDDIVIAYPDESVVVDDIVDPIKSTQPEILVAPDDYIYISDDTKMNETLIADKVVDDKNITGENKVIVDSIDLVEIKNANKDTAKKDSYVTSEKNIMEDIHEKLNTGKSANNHIPTHKGVKKLPMTGDTAFLNTIVLCAISIFTIVALRRREN